MSDNIYGQNVYSLKEKMWHGKGEVGQEEETAESVYSRMTPVQFEIRPFSISLNGKPFEGKDFGIVRTSGSSEVLVGRTRGRYNLIQPVEYCKIFDESVKQHVETLGFLGKDADRMFITWELPKIDVHGDKVEAYGFLATGFDGLFGEKLIVTNVRVVCANTWGMAVSAAEMSNDEGDGVVYNGKHCYTSHEKVLRSWMAYVQKQASETVAMQQALFCKMEETPVTVEQAFGLISQVYPYGKQVGSYYPDDLRSDRESADAKSNAKIDEKRDLAMNLFQGAGIQITPTVWGVLNAVTEAENNAPSKKDTTYSILLGNRHATMAKAVSVLADYVKAK